MIKCPFCAHANEDGSLYCDQCKTDLSIPVPELSTAAPEPAGMDFILEVQEGEADEPELDPTRKMDHIPIVQSLSEEPEAPTLPSPPKIEAPVAVAAPSVSENFDTQSAPTLAAPPSAAAPAAELKPRLVVIRGEKIDMHYPIYPGDNFIGRTDDKPVDIDLENQEPKDRIWSSRQHALITYENGALAIEDLNSLNGTFVNRTRVHPGQVRSLAANDIIQIGTVQMKVTFG